MTRRANIDFTNDRGRNLHTSCLTVPSGHAGPSRSETIMSDRRFGTYSFHDHPPRIFGGLPVRYLATAAFGLIAMTSAAAACPTYGQTGASYTYTGDQLYTPQSFGVVAGGQYNIANCGLPGVNRTGWVTSAPDFSFYLSGMDQYYLVADVVSQCDSILLVNTANTTWMFDDDSNGNLDPRLEIRGANNLNGRLDVWVGTYNGTYCDATLNMETWYAQAPAPGGGGGGGFQPAPQPPAPAPQPPAPAPQPAGGCPTWSQPGQTVYLTGQQLYSPTSYNVQAGGNTNISSCGVGGRGYAYPTPHYSFMLSGMEAYGRLEIEVTSASCDTTLLVNTPNTTWYFDDDSRGSLQPLLNIPSSANLNGRLDMWVGTYNGTSCPATVELETWYNAATPPAPQPPAPQPPAPPAPPAPVGGCPSWSQPGQMVYITGQQLYSPTSYNVQAGGTTNISSCGVGGRGYAYTNPHYSFMLSGMEAYGRLEIEVTSAACDTTLLVNTPNTTWYFDDDSRGNLQPELNIPSSANLNGRLDLWVGTYNGTSCPATVELETWYN